MACRDLAHEDTLRELCDVSRYHVDDPLADTFMLLDDFEATLCQENKL
jgi:hypothetical protein